MDKEAQAITDAAPAISPVTNGMVERAAAAFVGSDGHVWHPQLRAAIEAIAQDLINVGLREAVAVCGEVEREIDNETGLLHSVAAALTGISWARRCAHAITARIEEKEDVRRD